MLGSTTRRARAIVTALVLAVAVAACGGGGEQNAGAARAAAEGAFPVTIEHKYGSTTIPAAPQRVATVGLTDHDAVLALGVTPVALRDWFGDQPYGVWPWAQDELGNATPVVLSSKEINFEKVAAARPDLILAINSGLTKQEYEKLSQIAPTVAQSGEYPNFGTPWQVQTRTIGKALGRSDRADKLIDKVEAKFAAARKAHPEFQDATAVIAMTAAGGKAYPYAPHDARARFMSDLGFEQKPQIARLADDRFFAAISAERFDLLNADVLVWITQTQAQADALRSNPVYQTLPVVKEGRDIFLPQDKPLGAALSYNSVLSLPFAIDGIVPLLAAAVDGDPATEVPRGLGSPAGTSAAHSR